MTIERNIETILQSRLEEISDEKDRLYQTIESLTIEAEKIVTVLELLGDSPVAIAPERFERESPPPIPPTTEKIPAQERMRQILRFLNRTPERSYSTNQISDALNGLSPRRVLTLLNVLEGNSRVKRIEFAIPGQKGIKTEWQIIPINGDKEKQTEIVWP